MKWTNEIWLKQEGHSNDEANMDETYERRFAAKRVKTGQGRRTRFPNEAAYAGAWREA
jgi:hypothetical protein